MYGDRGQARMAIKLRKPKAGSWRELDQEGQALRSRGPGSGGRELRDLSPGSTLSPPSFHKYIGVRMERPWGSSMVNSIQIVHPTSCYTLLHTVSRAPTPSWDLHRSTTLFVTDLD